MKFCIQNNEAFNPNNEQINSLDQWAQVEKDYYIPGRNPSG